MKDESTRIPVQHCWKCGYKIDATTDATGNRKPHAGDISMCLACGSFAIFTKTLRLRKPTPSEYEMAFRHPVLTAAQMARASVVGDKLKKRRKKNERTKTRARH